MREAPERRDGRRWLSLAAAALSLALVAAACGSGSTAARVPRGAVAAGAGANRGCGPATGFLSEGETLPADCKVEELGTGRLLTLGDIQAGRPLVVNFWASWCVFCIKEMPDFQRVYASLEGRVEFVGLNLLGVQGETRGAAQTFARETGVRYPLAYDEGGELYLRMSPRLLMPTTVFVRVDGTIAARRFGPLTEKQLRDLIREELGVRA